MFTVKTRTWELPEREATPLSLFRSRRLLLGGGAGMMTAAAAGAFPARLAEAAPPGETLAPNPRYTLDRPLTDESLATSYNNFYEFGSHKNIAPVAQKRFVSRPWDVTVDGMVEKPFTMAFDELVRKMPVEDRVYRHRCVEAWAMAVPWRGFPLSRLVDLAQPASGARYLEMTTFMNPDMAPGQRQRWHPWPYREGLTLDEARNELAFVATGLYGKELPPQNGSPLRLVVPWKYGFKSIKSIVRFRFTDTRPVSFWETVQGNEYGFWANVNPEVPHPRWSQATEKLLGEEERRPTLLYNGYGEFVAHLYSGLSGERLFT